MVGVDDVARLAQEGVAIVVATADAELRPAINRAWGPRLDGSRLTLSVEAPAGSPMAGHLAAGTRMAATLSRLASSQKLQLRGPVVDVADPTPERLAAVAEHVDRFVAETAKVGVPETTARRLVGPELVSVTLEIDEYLDDDAPGGSS